MDEAEASGQVWRDEVRARPTAEQDRDALARLVEADADSFEVELYERTADPQVLSIDRAQRSHRLGSTPGMCGGFESITSTKEVEQ
ncbi:hypothetical protein ACFYPZ_19590 [Streptomyces sp. NPDC005506]|uniref:hypothetical protein n=1 Tax=Streptomyces sp. NPDC005506 TaxID=3364718 RepID=UPI0036CA7F20